MSEYDIYKHPEYLSKMADLERKHTEICNKGHDYAIANDGKRNGALITEKLYIEDQIKAVKRKEQDRYWGSK